MRLLQGKYLPIVALFGLLGNAYPQVLPDWESECLPPYCLGIPAGGESGSDTGLLAAAIDLTSEEWLDVATDEEQGYFGLHYEDVIRNGLYGTRWGVDPGEPFSEVKNMLSLNNIRNPELLRRRRTEPTTQIQTLARNLRVVDGKKEKPKKLSLFGRRGAAATPKSESESEDSEEEALWIVCLPHPVLFLCLVCATERE